MFLFRPWLNQVCITFVGFEQDGIRQDYEKV